MLQYVFFQYWVGVLIFVYRYLLIPENIPPVLLVRGRSFLISLRAGRLEKHSSDLQHHGGVMTRLPGQSGSMWSFHELPPGFPANQTTASGCHTQPAPPTLIALQVRRRFVQFSLLLKKPNKELNLTSSSGIEGSIDAYGEACVLFVEKTFIYARPMLQISC